jgi:hypothetical protein
VKVYWLNTVTGETAASQVSLTRFNEQTGNTVTVYAESVLAVGYKTTLFEYEDWGEYAVFSLPHVVADLGDVIPMRMKQRDDGYGVDERHSRIRTMREERASSSTASTRIHSFGSNTYD